MTYVLGADFATHDFMDSMIACHDDKKMMMMDVTNAGRFRLMANLLFGSLSISNSTSKVPWPLCGSNVNFRSGVNSFTCLPTGSRNDVGTTVYRRLWGCCWTDLICGSPLSLTNPKVNLGRIQLVPRQHGYPRSIPRGSIQFLLRTYKRYILAWSRPFCWKQWTVSSILQAAVGPIFSEVDATAAGRFEN